MAAFENIMASMERDLAQRRALFRMLDSNVVTRLAAELQRQTARARELANSLSLSSAVAQHGREMASIRSSSIGAALAEQARQMESIRESLRSLGSLQEEASRAFRLSIARIPELSIPPVIHDLLREPVQATVPHITFPPIPPIRSRQRALEARVAALEAKVAELSAPASPDPAPTTDADDASEGGELHTGQYL